MHRKYYYVSSAMTRETWKAQMKGEEEEVEVEHGDEAQLGSARAKRRK